MAKKKKSKLSSLPKKKETLVAKQGARLRRLGSLSYRLPELSSRWWVGMGEILGLLFLFALSLFLLYPFFGQEDVTNFFSAPLIPILATVLESLVPFGYGIRIWLVTLMAFFPLTFYFFVREVSGRRLVAFLANLIVCLPLGIFLSYRIKLGLLGGDGAHMAAMTLIPLVCLLLLRFLRKGQFWSGIFSAAGTTLVALASPIGVLVLIVFMSMITFSEMLLGQARIKVIRFLLVLVLATGLMAFWYSPHFVIFNLRSAGGQRIVKTFANLLPISFFTVPLLAIFGFLLFENRPQLQPYFVAFFLTVGFGLFSLGAGVDQTSPSRFIPAFGISLAFLLSLLLIMLFDFLRFSPKLKRFPALMPHRQPIAYGFIFLVFALFFAVLFFQIDSFGQLRNVQVLGIESEKITGFWETKQANSQSESLLGYLITSATALAVFVLKARLGM